MPECSDCTCMLVCVSSHNFAHETAGAARTRLSLRPLLFGAAFLASLGRIAPRGRGVVSTTMATSLRGAKRRRQSILSLCGPMDCFASLAMTVSDLHVPAVSRNVGNIVPSETSSTRNKLAKSTLAPMVNRVLTSPYLWWFDWFPVVLQFPRPLLKVLAFQTWQ